MTGSSEVESSPVVTKQHHEPSSEMIDNTTAPVPIAAESSTSSATKRALEPSTTAATDAELPAKQSKRLRKQTPEQRIAAAYRFKIEKAAHAGDARGALALFQEMQAAGVAIQPYMYRVIISVCAKADKTSHELQRDTFAVVDAMAADAAAASSMDESIYSALIKLCSKNCDFARCHALIAELEAKAVATKLRTFAPLLQAYSAAGDLTNCLAIKHKAAEHGLELSEPEFIALLDVCAAAGDATQFYATLDEYADVVPRMDVTAWSVLKRWFASDAAQVDGRKWTSCTSTVSESGVCAATGKQLLSVELSPAQETALLEKIESLVRTDERRTNEWGAFKTWLDVHGPFDVVIDAANVGYYNQNYAGGDFSYAQIETLVKHYEEKHQRVLIVLHKRRTLDAQVPPADRPMVAMWAESHKMFNCQPGNNDDWYWLYAAVKLGGRTLAVTNDEMRDHHFSMIHNRAFMHWKERHQARYSMNDFRWHVHEPAAFSTRPQRIGDDAWHFPPGAPGSETWLCFTLENANAPAATEVINATKDATTENEAAPAVDETGAGTVVAMEEDVVEKSDVAAE